MPRKRGVARYLRDTYKAGRLSALRQSPRSGSAATKVKRKEKNLDVKRAGTEETGLFDMVNRKHVARIERSEIRGRCRERPALRCAPCGLRTACLATTHSCPGRARASARLFAQGAGSRARAGTQGPHDVLRGRRCCASHFFCWVPGLAPLARDTRMVGAATPAQHPPRCTGRAEARARPGHERVAADAMALRHLADASHRIVSYSPCQTAQFLQSRLVLRPGLRFPFLPSQLPIPERGDGGAPGGGILYPVAPVTTRRHVCEAWAVPRNRDGASRRSTVTVLGPLRARLRSCLRLACAGDPCCRHRFRSSKGPEPPGNGFTSRPRTPPPAPPSGNASRKRPS